MGVHFHLQPSLSPYLWVWNPGKMQWTEIYDVMHAWTTMPAKFFEVSIEQASRDQLHLIHLLNYKPIVILLLRTIHFTTISIIFITLYLLIFDFHLFVPFIQITVKTDRKWKTSLSCEWLFVVDLFSLFSIAMTSVNSFLSLFSFFSLFRLLTLILVPLFPFKNYQFLCFFNNLERHSTMTFPSSRKQESFRTRIEDQKIVKYLLPCPFCEFIS